MSAGAGPFTSRNLRRATRLWSTVALWGSPFFLLLGVALLTGLFPSGAARASVVETTATPGTAIDVVGGTRGMALWGQPADVDLSTVTCRWTGAGDSGGELPVGPRDDRPEVITDSLGSGDYVWLTTTADTFGVRSATCTAHGLTALGATPDPGTGAGTGAGVFFVVLAPVLLGLGLLARRAARSA
ncbi:hypothetical protein [Actinotalea sp. K2]|uniref:hypothetical protein n=1 Tax=Actinotalea sp. K2 TaxID=2939438 RepID=UPI00201823C0|nr:hypothetical protein [Actinotalea sp. K2]MCL3859927.1 hypothetical protein [Actinotalea sp. K2]